MAHFKTGPIMFQMLTTDEVKEKFDSSNPVMSPSVTFDGG